MSKSLLGLLRAVTHSPFGPGLTGRWVRAFKPSRAKGTLETMKTKSMKAKRYPLELGGESSAVWSGHELPEAKSYDFDPTTGYPITFKDESAGEGHVERDARGQLWVTPSFGITFDEVKFHAFWQVQGDKAVLGGIVMVVRESPTQQWV